MMINSILVQVIAEGCAARMVANLEPLLDMVIIFQRLVFQSNSILYKISSLNIFRSIRAFQIQRSEYARQLAFVSGSSLVPPPFILCNGKLLSLTVSIQ